MRVPQDVHFALRLFWRTPLTSVVAVLLLGVGISMTALGREMARAPALMGVAHPEAVATLGMGRPGLSPGEIPVAFIEEVIERTREVGTVSLADVAPATLGTPGGGQAERQLAVAQVTPGLLGMVDARPARGRLFAPDEYQGEGAPVVLLSDRAWRRELASREDVLGATLMVGKTPRVVVGVMPAGFVFPRCQAWVPTSQRALEGSNGSGDGMVTMFVARARGATWEAVHTRVDVIAAALKSRLPHYFVGSALMVQTLSEQRGMRAGQFFVLFQGPPLLLLLVTILSVAGVLFSRTLAREHELGVRMALGASRWRLARQFSLETLVLALPAGALAFALLPLELRILRSVPGSEGLDMFLGAVVLRGDTLAAAMAATLVAVGLPTLAPLLVSRRIELTRALRRSLSRPFGAFRRYTVRDLLVVVQVAAAFLLLSLTAFFGRFGWSMLHPVYGYDRSSLVAMRLSLGSRECEGVCRDHLLALAGDTLAHAVSSGGIDGATVAADLPMPEPGYTDLHGQVRSAAGPLTSRRSYVGGGFFSTLGVRLLRGRPIDDQDIRAARQVVVVSRALAENAWPGADPLGRVLSVHQGDGSPASFEVVGVAPDINYLSVDGRSSRMIYLPVWAMPVEAHGLSILLRSQGDLRATMERLRGTLVPERPGSPLALPQTYDTALAAESSPDIKNLPFMLGILAIPAILALIVAVVGIASVTAETVAASRRGLAIRAAVGAPPAALVRQVLGHAFVKVGLGLLIPLGMASVLFSSGGPGGPPLGPILISTIFLSIVGGGLAIVLTACYLPARVAARVDVAQLARDE